MTDASGNPVPDREATLEGGTDPRTGLVRWKKNADILALLGIICAFSAFYFSLSFLRFTGFYGANWDLGVNMQAAWTNTHGYLVYASGVSESIRAGSFLFVHPTYVLFPVSWLYSLAPYFATLFAVQAVVIASSAVPLYLLGRRARVPQRILFAGIAVYLASLPILSGFLFDFHWEAFIPAEFLWTFYLWERGRFWWAVVPATLGFFTLEVFPPLVIGIAAYFAWPFIRAYFTAPKKSLHQVWTTLKGPALPLVGLAALAGVGYIGPSLVAQYLLPSVAGGGPVFPPAGPNSLFGVYYWGVSASTLGARLLYWLVLFSSFGFLPLLYRQRLLILSLPWGINTVIMTPNYVFTTFGFQYSLIAVAPLAIGFVEGLGAMARAPKPGLQRGLPSWGWLLLLLPFLAASLTSPLLLIRPTPTEQWLGLAIGLWVLAGVLAFRYATFRQASIEPTPSRFMITPPRGRKVAQVALVAAIVVLVGSNVALSPLNPVNFLGPGEASYSFTYSPSPSYGYMSALVGHIPAGAPIVASDNLFPFVANNPQAYSLLWYPSAPTYLPFNATNLPQYVLLSTSQWFVPGFLNSVLFNQSVYGVVAMLYSASTYPGSIYLFQLGYSGYSDVVQVTAFPAKTVLCGNDLVLGPSGIVVPASGTRCGTVVESRPAINLSGNGATIWYGPYSTLLPGNYSVTISLEGALSGPGPSNAPILVMNANAVGTGYWYNVVIQANEVSTTQWTNFTYHFNLTSPQAGAEWRGYLAGPTVNGQFIPGSDELNFIEVDWAAYPA
jgi:uncharacterized membrane protein